jgi:hypothetical protein
MTDETTQGAARVSRRGLVKGAALGAAVVVAGGTSAQAASAPATAGPGVEAAAGTSAAQKAQPIAHGDGELVVHVRDLSTGDLDVYAGVRHVRVRDRDLAARLSSAAR